MPNTRISFFLENFLSWGQDFFKPKGAGPRWFTVTSFKIIYRRIFNLKFCCLTHSMDIIIYKFHILGKEDNEDENYKPSTRSASLRGQEPIVEGSVDDHSLHESLMDRLKRKMSLPRQSASEVGIRVGQGRTLTFRVHTWYLGYQSMIVAGIFEMDRNYYL